MPGSVLTKYIFTKEMEISSKLIIIDLSALPQQYVKWYIYCTENNLLTDT